MFFKQKSFTVLGLKCYIIISKLFIWHLSRRIDRTYSAEKGVAIGKSQTVINWKRIDEERHLCTQTYSGKHSSWLEKVQYEITFWETFSALLPSIYLLLKSLLSKLLTLPYQLCRQKKFVYSLHPNWSFSSQSLIIFSYRHSFLCPLYSDNFSGQVSHEKRRKYKHFNERKTFLFEKKFWGGKSLIYIWKLCFWKKNKKTDIFEKKTVI